MDNLYNWIEALGKERGFKTVTALCRKADMSPSTLTELKSAGRVFESHYQLHKKSPKVLIFQAFWGFFFSFADNQHAHIFTCFCFFYMQKICRKLWEIM